MSIVNFESAQTAVLKIKKVKHPISQMIIGFRLQAAIPNESGGRFDKEGVSFRQKYLIMESSDHSEITPDVVERFVSDLQRLKYTDFVMVS